MLCPKCRREFEEGTTICPECNVSLCTSLKKTKKKLVLKKVACASNEVEARMIMDVLRDNNIQCVSRSAEAGAYLKLYMGYSVYGEEIYVDRDEFKQAVEILREFCAYKAPEDEADTNSNYRGPLIKRPHFIARVTVIFAIVINVLIYILTKTNITSYLR